MDRLEDVVYIPLQAVDLPGRPTGGLCARCRRAQAREVEVGSFSESFIEIRSGLRAGEEVLLLPPQQQSATVASN